jgi:hypothetical protein
VHSEEGVELCPLKNRELLLRALDSEHTTVLAQTLQNARYSPSLVNYCLWKQHKLSKERSDFVNLPEGMRDSLSLESLKWKGLLNLLKEDGIKLDQETYASYLLPTPETA